MSWRFVRPGLPDAAPFRDGSVSHSGTFSARIEHTAGGNCPNICGYWTAPIAATPGQQYTISVWFRGDDAVVSKAGVVITMRVQAPDGAYQPLYAFLGRADSNAWDETTATFAVPAGFSSILIDISWWRNMAFPDATGVIWIDDVSVVAAP